VNQDREDAGAWAVGGFVGYAGFTLGASYGDNGDTRGGTSDVDDDFFYDVGLGYSMGPWSASVGYRHRRQRRYRAHARSRAQLLAFGIELNGTRFVPFFLGATAEAVAPFFLRERWDRVAPDLWSSS
jgi:predicted porin